MLSAQDNELLCDVAPDTPMGELMRLYWIPAFTSGELSLLAVSTCHHRCRLEEG